MSAEDSFRFKLTDEQRRIVATVRDLTQSEFKPRGLQYMNGAFPWENIASLAKVGVLGMAVPQAYGGTAFGVPKVKERTIAIAMVLHNTLVRRHATATMSVASHSGGKTA